MWRTWPDLHSVGTARADGGRSHARGMHAASEVPIAYTPEACVELVQVAEETQRHCIMLENCCYNREELWLLNMIQDGVFGTVTHAECAYLHDLRALMLDPTYYEDQWRPSTTTRATATCTRPTGWVRSACTSTSCAGTP